MEECLLCVDHVHFRVRDVDPYSQKVGIFVSGLQNTDRTLAELLFKKNVTSKKMIILIRQYINIIFLFPGSNVRLTYCGDA